MKSDLTQIAMVLDRSGSMSSVRDATIAGFNEFVEGQKNAPGDALFTFVQFDSENPYEVLADGKPIKEMSKLTAETFVPRGGTPLHDAIGRTVTSLGSKLLSMKESDRPSKVVVVIMTDGQENSSREYTSAQIADMIKHQREAYKWEFVFLGANQDACLTGEKLNIGRSNSVMYNGMSGQATMDTMSNAGRNVSRYRSTGSAQSLAFSTKQRNEAMEDEK